MPFSLRIAGYQEVSGGSRVRIYGFGLTVVFVHFLTHFRVIKCLLGSENGS